MDNSSLVFRSLFSIATNLILGGNPYEIQRKTSHIIYIDFEVFLFPTILFHVHWNIFKKNSTTFVENPNTAINAQETFTTAIFTFDDRKWSAIV